jgi:hypothetical protein
MRYGEFPAEIELKHCAEIQVSSYVHQEGVGRVSGQAVSRSAWMRVSPTPNRVECREYGLSRSIRRDPAQVVWVQDAFAIPPVSTKRPSFRYAVVYAGRSSREQFWRAI